MGPEHFDPLPLHPEAVARRLGVAVSTLRTWHQRYGLGPTGHTAGRHRRYSRQDLARLELMLDLTSRGVRPAQAAALAKAWDEAAGKQETGSVPERQARQGLLRAAARLDAHVLRVRLRQAIAAHGVVRVWHDLLCPVLVTIGEISNEDSRQVAMEHVLSRVVSEVFAAQPRPALGTIARTVLACAPEEQHSLPLEALAAALAERHIPALLLGARVPPQALRSAVVRARPHLVVLWSQQYDTGDPAHLRALLGLAHPPAYLAAGGPGWPESGLPPGVLRPATLDAILPYAPPPLPS